MKKNNVSEKKAKWRREHDQFMKAIKMSRLIKKVEMQGGDISKIPVAPSEPNEDYIEWQYWYRRYAPKVADRHIPKWKDMINRPKPPPHILKKMQNNKTPKMMQKLTKRKVNSSLVQKDPKNLTANAFGKDLQTDNYKEIFNTQYPFQGPLKRIPEQNEDENLKISRRDKNLSKTEVRGKRGKSMNHKALKSNGFSKSGINNNSSYQSNFNDAAISTSTSKHFINNVQNEHQESKQNIHRSDSLIARSTSYSAVPCPYWDRKFSSNAAERHIPIWKNILNKPTALKQSIQKRSSIQLPHLSKTNYNSGFENNLMNNTSSTFRTNETKQINEQLSQTSGLPPTYKSPGSKLISKTRKDFAMKKWFWTSWGYKYKSEDKFCAMWGDKRIIH